MRKIVVLLGAMIFLFTACFKDEEQNKILEGEFSYEQKDGKTFLYYDKILATGIVQGHDDILGLAYDMKFNKGLPTGEVVFYEGTMKLIETNLKYNFYNGEATGDVTIFETDENNNIFPVVEYKNIVSTTDKFLTDNGTRPSLNWYVDNPLNIFKKVEIYKNGKKIAGVQDGKYYFYDEDGNAFDVGTKPNKEDFDVNKYLNDDFDEVNYVDLDLTDKSNAINAIFEATDKSVKRLKQDGLYVTGDVVSEDEYGNRFDVRYNAGIPSGKFDVLLAELDNFRINGDGAYDLTQDIWKGTILINDSDGDAVALKNVVMKGRDLFTNNNEIMYEWINYTLKEDEPIDLTKSKYFNEAEIYFNNTFVGKIQNGVFMKAVK